MELWHSGGFHEESRFSVRALNAKICHCVSLNFLFLLIYPSHMCASEGGVATEGAVHRIVIRSKEDGFCERVYKNCKRDPGLAGTYGNTWQGVFTENIQPLAAHVQNIQNMQNYRLLHAGRSSWLSSPPFVCTTLSFILFISIS